jgi:hypothetical protein
MVGGILCYFSKNSLLAGNLAGAFGMESSTRFGWGWQAGRSRTREAGWLQIACKCSHASMQEGLT